MCVVLLLDDDTKKRLRLLFTPYENTPCHHCTRCESDFVYRLIFSRSLTLSQANMIVEQRIISCSIIFDEVVKMTLI